MKLKYLKRIIIDIFIVNNNMNINNISHYGDILAIPFFYYKLFIL